MYLARSCRVMVATLAMGFLSLQSSALAQYKWDMTESYSPTALSGQAVGEFAKLVNERSGGRITITVHYNGSLGIAEKDLLSSVEQGVVPISSTIVDKALTTLPIASVQFMPFMTGGLVEARAMAKVVRPYIEAELAKMNQVYLFETFGLPVGIWSKKPVNSLESLKTIKLRTNNPNSTKTFQAAGASPIFLAWSDVTPALATGLIDAVLTSDESGISVRFFDQLKYYTRLNFEIGIWMTHMNKTVFDKLSDDLKKVVLEAAKETGEKAYERSLNRLDENSKTLKANGVTITDDTPPEFRKHLLNAGGFLLDDWKKRVGAEKANKILGAFDQEKKSN